MKYSIIIPTYNHLEDLLKPCLESVIEYTDMDDKEIIVVCNGCDDGTQDWVKSQAIENLKVLDYPEPLGFLKATNIGMTVAKGDYVILLNNDTVILTSPIDRWIDMLNRPFVEDVLMGMTGVLGTKWDFGYRFSLVGMCLMISRELINEIGYLDEIFGEGYGEDCDYSFKAIHAGFEIKEVGRGAIFPIYHKTEGTYGEIPERAEIVQRNAKILKERWDTIIKAK